MDWQDILSLVVFLLLVVFSKKRKPEEKTMPPVEDADIEMVRKKIEALKRQRCENFNEKSLPQAPRKETRPIFSAYSHLSKLEAAPVAPLSASEITPIVPIRNNANVALKPIDPLSQKAKVRDWMLGQIILGTPAYKRYGNFICR